MRIDGPALAALLPQQGTRGRIDSVDAFDATRIVCSTTRHADPVNPLREDGRLSSLAGIEFAAQAMAAHGALLGDRQPVHGWLARVRDCVVSCERMDTLPGPLRIEAERLAGDARALSYRFTISSRGAPVLEGSALIARMPGDAP